MEREYMANGTALADHLLTMLGEDVASRIPRCISHTPMEMRIEPDLPVIPLYKNGVLADLLDRDTLDPFRPPVYGPPTPVHLLLHKSADERLTSAVSQVYFIGGDEGAIKIGYSVCPESRLRAIQSCSPIPLRILARCPGNEEKEGAYHFQFAEYRLHGEWFERHPDLLREIDRLNALTRGSDNEG